MRRKKNGKGRGGGLHTVAARSRVNPGDPARARATLLLGSGCGAHFHIFFSLSPSRDFHISTLSPRACVSRADTRRTASLAHFRSHVYRGAGPVVSGFLPQDVRRNPASGRREQGRLRCT